MNLTELEQDALPQTSTGPDAREPDRGPSDPPRSRRTSILQLSVPIIVRVAEREMKLRAILEITQGTILEFNTRADAELDLLVNNRLVGKGLAVKVGENFGLRLTRLLPAELAHGGRG